MKPISFFTLLIIAVISPQLLLGAPEASITVHALSDSGQSLPNLPISLSTFDHWQPGEGFGQDKYSNVSGKTDSNGVVSFSVSSTRGDIGIGTDTPLNGVYQASLGYQFTNSSGGKWQPWNPTVDFVVKPILNPIAMYARVFGHSPDPKLPIQNAPVGFDLEAGDYVAPYGKGTVSDLIFTLVVKIPFVSYGQPFDYTLTVSLSNKGDGIQSVIVGERQRGGLRLSRFAPLDGYQRNLVQETARSLDGKLLNPQVNEDQNYFFRVRSVLDDQGKVRSALYGKIYGPIQFWSKGFILFTYYLNPTPNDRNMEFDPKRNLFQNLTSDQKVHVP